MAAIHIGLMCRYGSSIAAPVAGAARGYDSDNGYEDGRAKRAARQIKDIPRPINSASWVD